MTIDANIAIIGAGNLGSALATGLLDSGALIPARLFVSDSSQERLDLLREREAAYLGGDNAQAAAKADVIVLAVKPPAVTPVLGGIAGGLRPSQVVVSLAAAVPLAAIERELPSRQPAVRAMPNIAMTVHASATALCANEHSDERSRELVQRIFSTVGETLFVDEPQMHAVTGLSGSGPAYVSLMIEGLAAGGVKMGLPVAAARLLAAQTVLGTARLLLQTGAHPAELRDQVTTPGGTTIHGLHALEEQGVRGALMAAVEAATLRSLDLAELLHPPAPKRRRS
jgi:pyrroline-5-carboxylate reductase